MRRPVMSLRRKASRRSWPLAGKVDILVNNAGWFEPKDAFEISDADWQKAFDVNVMSGVRLTRALAPHMREKGFGRIVFISSESGVQIPTEMIHYGMSKTAQLSLTRGFAQALAKTGVTVNAVLPGPTLSEGVGGFIENLAKAQGKTVAEVEKGFFEHARPTSLLKRFIDPEEVANVVAFVCSREASAINGAPIRAEGGVVMSMDRVERAGRAPRLPAARSVRRRDPCGPCRRGRPGHSWRCRHPGERPARWRRPGRD